MAASSSILFSIQIKLATEKIKSCVFSEEIKMPRTKLTKKVTNKRNRNSTADDLRVNAMSDIDRGKFNK